MNADDQDNAKSIYDPEAKNVHFFGPDASVIDATQPHGTSRFRFLPESRTILGHSCRGVERQDETTTDILFVCPDIWVDPSHYVQHKFGDWGELLRFTQGALPLYWEFAGSDGRVVLETTGIERKNFDAQFWEKAFWKAMTR